MNDLLNQLILSTSKEHFYRILEDYFSRPMNFISISKIEDHDLSNAIIRLYHLLFLNSTPATTYDALVDGLMQGIYRNEEEARGLMHALNVTPLDYFQIGILKHQDPYRLKNILANMKVIHHMVYTIKDQMGYIIFTYSNKETPPYQNMKEMAEKYHAYLYLSLEYSNLIDSAPYFKQVQLLSMNKWDEYLIKIKDHYLDSLLFRLERDLLSSYILPEIRILLDYDTKKHTSYYTTLKIYLKNHQDIPATINELEINRSTLFYRFKKIGEILHTDFYNLNLFEYELSISIFENLQK